MSDRRGLTLDQLERQVADQIIALMERDGLNWIQGWATPLPPQNFHTGHVYSGTNTLTTGLWLMRHGKSDPRFLTFKQAVERGGSIRKGSKGIPIVYYGTYVRSDDDSPEGAERRSRFARLSHAFHVSDVEGIEIPELDLCAPEPRQRNAEIDAFVEGTGCPILDGGMAFYNETHDAITMPPIGMFRDTDGVSAEELYYSVLLHELIHFTGPPKRLGRECFIDYAKNRAARAFEELIAEIGSVMLGQRLGLVAQPREDNAAYVQSWIRHLKDKPGSVFQAAAAASRAITLLEDLQPKEQEQAA